MLLVGARMVDERRADRRRLRRLQPLPRHARRCRCARSGCGSARRSARRRRASGSSRSWTSRRRSPSRPDAVELPPGAGGPAVRARRASSTSRAGRCSTASTLDVAAGPDDRADRPHRLGEDDAHLARPALLRRHRRPRAGRRRRRPRREADLAAPRDRRHLAGPVPLLGDRPREHRLRRARPRRRRGRADRAARAGARVHRAAAGRLRHDHRRARDHALGRPAPAARDRPRARGRPAHPDPRRRDRLGRRLDRGADPRRPARGDARTGRR